MSYQVAKEELEKAGDNTVGGVVVSLVFVFLTIAIYGLLGTRTTLLGDSVFVQTLTQIVLGGILILLITIFANYRVLKWVRNDAKKVIYWGFMGTIMFFVGGLFLLGLIPFLFGGSEGAAAGSIFLFFALIAAVIAYFIWRFIESRIERAARWLSVAAGVVMSEPGMLLMSFIQSVVLMIGSITQFIVVLYYQYGTDTSEDQLKSIMGIISFVYIWYGFFTLYYFGGVNTYMSYARIKGVDPTIGQGISSATRRIPSLLLYSLISTIVTVITRFRGGDGRSRRSGGGNNNINITDAGEIVGAILSAIVGSFMRVFGGILRYLYFLVSFFTLPIIIIRRKGAFAAMRESYEYFRSNPWNIIISDMSFGLGVWAIYLFSGIISGTGGFLYGVALSFIFGSGESFLGFGILLAFLTFIVGLFITKLFISPLFTAFTTTIYVYASEGPEAIAVAPPELIQQIESSVNSTAAMGPMAGRML